MAAVGRLTAGCVVVALAAGCGDDSDDVSSTTTPKAAAPTRFATTTVPGLTTSPQETYEEAKSICGLKHAREIAADFNLTTRDRDAIARRYARGYDERLREPAQVGCREGLDAYSRKHPNEKPTPPDRAELAQRFLLRVDDYAIKLEEAIKAAQDDDPGASQTIARLRDRIAAAARSYRRKTRIRSSGARQLVRVADGALAAIAASDVRALVRARVAMVDARRALARDLGK